MQNSHMTLTMAKQMEICKIEEVRVKIQIGREKQYVQKKGNLLTADIQEVQKDQGWQLEHFEYL